MFPLNTTPAIDTTLNTQAEIIYRVLQPKQDQYMQTPCMHKYHVSCMLNWMTIKMECPNCRKPLPSVE